IGAVFFGETGGRFQQAFSSDEGPNLDDPAAALARLHALLGSLSGAEVEESEVCMSAYAHPVLPSIAAFTCEQGQDGAVAYRLYRNPNVEREKAIGYLQRLLKQFQTGSGESPGPN
ncbi:MAG TPA: hypothetical protein VL283_03295, partial [Candidatus Baltobacteraceae bacterium]|nr:hypothetical protein [Candidatus Baltobacteraceae bacterium]